MNNLLCYFHNLRHHRRFVVEEIRKVSWRNLNAFHDAMGHLGLDRATRREDFVAVIAHMLATRGLPINEETHSILKWTLWLPWQVYHCLLYAEIESYRKTSVTLPSIQYPPLSDFLHENGDAVNSLMDVRNKILHPQNKAELEDVEIMFIKHASRTSGDGFTFVRDLQDHLDACIDQLEEKAVEMMLAKYDLIELPNDPSDAEIMQVLKKSRRFMQEVPLWAYLPVPSIELSARRILTSEQFGFWISALQFGPDEDRTQVVPANVRRAAPGMWLIVLQAYVLTAELMSNTTINDGEILSGPRPSASENSDVHNHLRSLFWQQKVGMQNALLRVAASLLMEPIRIYRCTVKKEPSCRSTAVEDDLPSDDVLYGIREYRNRVFHVEDRDKTDPRCSDQSLGKLLNGTDWKRLCESLIKWNFPQQM